MIIIDGETEPTDRERERENERRMKGSRCLVFISSLIPFVCSFSSVDHDLFSCREKKTTIDREWPSLKQ